MQYVVPEVDPLTAQRWLDNQEALFVDVRELHEHEQANIPSAKLIPLSTFSLDKLPVLALGQKMVVVCASGVRSARIIQALNAHDLELPLYNLTGGILAWIQLGLPAVMGK